MVFIKQTIAAAIVVCTLFICASPAFSSMPSPQGIQEVSDNASLFCEESLVYTISFWLFRKAAVGTLACTRKKDDTYEAVFEARSAGMLRMLMGKRRGIMKSTMEYDRKQKRFRPLTFQESFIKGDAKRTKTIHYQYDQGTYTVIREGYGGKPLRKTRKVEGEAVDDILTAFYNLRLGCFGVVQPECRLTIPVLVNEKKAYISLVFDGKKAPRRPAAAYYAEASMSRHISEVRSKRISGWFTDRLVPLKGVIKNAYYFGDIVLRLSDGKKDPGES